MARVRPLNTVTEVGNSRLRLGEAKKLGNRLRSPQSAPRSRKTARKGGSGEAFCAAATAPDGARASSLHGRNPDGAAAVRRSTPAKFGEGVQEACGVRRAGRSSDPAQPRLRAGTPARRPPLLNETKN
jgi:hypothetical protein